MRSSKPGRSTSVELVRVRSRGIVIRVDERELTLPFVSFPWFREAPSAQLARIERVDADHIRWPDLDVDLTLSSIEHPERYPLVSKVRGA